MQPRIFLWSPLDDYLADMLEACTTIQFSRIRSAADLPGAFPDADAIVVLGHSTQQTLPPWCENTSRRCAGST